MEDNDVRQIWTTPEKFLRDENYFNALWFSCKKQTHIISRAWIWALSAYLRDLETFNIHIYDSKTGNPVTEFPDLDAIFPDRHCDGRWFRLFLQAAPGSSGLRPRRISKNTRKLSILDLYARSTISKFSLFAHGYAPPQGHNGKESGLSSSTPPVFPDLRYIPKYDVFLKENDVGKEMTHGKDTNY